MSNLGYILEQDLLANISSDTLTELTGGRKAIGSNSEVQGSDVILAKAIPAQVEMMLGYTRHFYDVDTETRTIRAYNETDEFAAGDRVAGNQIDGNRPLYLCIEDAPAGTVLTNLQYFEEVDDRNPVLIEIVCHLVIYNLSRRQNPRQIPEQRQIDYENAISRLKDIQRGYLQLDIAEREEIPADDPGQEFTHGEFEGITHDTY